MPSLLRSNGRLAITTVAVALGIGMASGSTARSDDGEPVAPGPHGEIGQTSGTLGWAPYGYYPGFYGFSLKFHPGYGYGVGALGVGADGGYPFYGGPGYYHPGPRAPAVWADRTVRVLLWTRVSLQFRDSLAPSWSTSRWRCKQGVGMPATPRAVRCTPTTLDSGRSRALCRTRRAISPRTPRLRLPVARRPARRRQCRRRRRTRIRSGSSVSTRNPSSMLVVRAA